MVKVQNINAFSTRVFHFLIFLSLMANWAHCGFCFHKDYFSFRNSWYLCREHFTDFNRLFVIGNNCGKTLWSMINLWELIDISWILTLSNLLFKLNPLSTAAWPNSLLKVGLLKVGLFFFLLGLYGRKMKILG